MTPACKATYPAVLVVLTWATGSPSVTVTYRWGTDGNGTSMARRSCCTQAPARSSTTWARPVDLAGLWGVATYAGERDVSAGVAEHILQRGSSGSARLAEELDHSTWLRVEGDGRAFAPGDSQEQLVLAVRHGQFDALAMLDLADRIAVNHDDVASGPVAPPAMFTGDHDGCVVGVAVHAMTLKCHPDCFAPSSSAGASSWRVGAGSRAARGEAEGCDRRAHCSGSLA